ncbi:hypothetical protein GYA49_00615 [Candidatus Beckwithbacteria bacterium]|nr:hypothetical protein [Candidatus Beckwithbacteria bacterium]
MNYWKIPPKIKIYEAIGCIADKRIKITQDKKSAIVKSSSGNKKYQVFYKKEKQEILANDNGSYWQGYLGYPAIAFLIEIGKIEYDQSVNKFLNNLAWKDINVKFKNDYHKTIRYVLTKNTNEEDKEKLINEINGIYNQLKNLKLKKLEKNIKPPVGY